MRLLDTLPGPRTNARRAALQAFARAWEPARAARQSGQADPAAEAALSLAVERLRAPLLVDLAADVRDLLGIYPHLAAITWTQTRVGTNPQLEFASDLPQAARTLLAVLPRDALLEIFGPARIRLDAHGMQITPLRA